MNDGLRRVAAIGLAVAAAGLMLFALLAMATSEFAYAGLAFLTASIVIYYRETVLV